MAGFVGVEIIGHDLLEDVAILFDEVRAEVEVVDVLVVVELGEDLIDLKNATTPGADGLGTGEDAEEQDVCMRVTGAFLGDDFGDVCEDVGIGVMRGVVFVAM